MAVIGDFSATGTRAPTRGRVCARLPRLACLLLIAIVLPPVVAQGGTRPLPGLARSLAASPAFTIRLAHRLEPELAGTEIATLAQARHLFGPPALIAPRAETPTACTASWPALGLVIDFSTTRPPSCASQDTGSWVEITATAKRWHTQAGLQVTDSQRRLHDLYPNARNLTFLGYGQAWQLETGGPLCDGGPPLTLAALIRAGHVHALAVIHVPACG